MNNKKILQFERLNHTDSFKLIGGFSIAFDTEMQQDSTQKVNNCHGGNFKVGCGGGHKNKKDTVSKHLPNKNCKGNCVPGCGDKK